MNQFVAGNFLLRFNFSKKNQIVILWTKEEWINSLLDGITTPLIPCSTSSFIAFRNELIAPFHFHSQAPVNLWATAMVILLVIIVFLGRKGVRKGHRNGETFTFRQRAFGTKENFRMFCSTELPGGDRITGTLTNVEMVTKIIFSPSFRELGYRNTRRPMTLFLTE